MRRLATSFAAAALVLGAGAGLFAPAAMAGELRWVDYDRGLFLRSGPGRTRGIIGGVEYGEAVELMRVLPGDWGHIRRGDGSIGYARANHLAAAAPPAKPITWCWTRHLFVTAEVGLNVRSGPGTSFPVVGTLAHGEGLVDCKETARGWTKVRDGLGVVGYVYSSYLTTSAPPPRLPPIEIGSAGAVVFRARASDAEVVSQLPAGARLDALTGNWDGFVKVRLPDTRTGFVLTTALAGTGGSGSGGGLAVVLLVGLGLLGCLFWLARRAGDDRPAEVAAPTAPSMLEQTVPAAPPAVVVPPTPPTPKRPAPPFKLPPLPGGVAAEADASAAFAGALARSLSD